MRSVKERTTREQRKKNNDKKIQKQALEDVSTRLNVPMKQ